MTAHLEWSDDWLVLVAGPWRIAVADIEADADGATLYLHDWTRTDPTEHSLQGKSGEASQEIRCRSVAEARLVCARLLDLRGVDVPTPTEDTP